MSRLMSMCFQLRIYIQLLPHNMIVPLLSHTELTSKFLSLPPTSNLSTPISRAINTSAYLFPQDPSSSLSLPVPSILSLSPIVPESPHHMPEIFAPAESIPSPSPDISSTTQPSLECSSLPSRMITRSVTGSLKPKQLSDFHLYHSTKHPLKAFHTIILPPEPTTFSQASKSQHWRDVITAEYNALISNGTWTLCPRPSHKHVIRNKWVYKLKQKSDGTIDRYKARLVAKSFEQQDGIDYTKTFSPVIKPATIRLILALAVHYDWIIWQLDVSNAFLHGQLTNEVFMEQPQGFVDSPQSDSVCRLHKSLCSLKQAPRAWFQRLSQVLLDLGFMGSTVDTSLFVFLQEVVRIYVLIYVDDIIVTSNKLTAISDLITKLQYEFSMKDLGPLSYLLGIQVHRNR